MWRRGEKERLAGADPGLEKGWGTPNQNDEKSKSNDVHHLLN